MEVSRDGFRLLGEDDRAVVHLLQTANRELQKSLDAAGSVIVDRDERIKALQGLLKISQTTSHKLLEDAARAIAESERHALHVRKERDVIELALRQLVSAINIAEDREPTAAEMDNAGCHIRQSLELLALIDRCKAAQPTSEG